MWSSSEWSVNLSIKMRDNLENKNKANKCDFYPSSMQKESSIQLLQLYIHIDAWLQILFCYEIKYYLKDVPWI